MAKISIRMSKLAAEKVRKPDDLQKAALTAFQAAGGGDLFFVPFKANGQQFALSSRTVIEVDWLPGRVPEQVIREGKPVRKGGDERKGKPPRRDFRTGS